MISRRTLALTVLLCAVLSMVGAALMPDADAVVTSTTNVLVASAWGLEVASWVGMPILAWFVSVRVWRIRQVSAQVGRSPSLLTGQYIGVLLLFALACEAPYDYIRSGQWWDARSQNPLWAVVIALVALLVWDAVEAYGPNAKRATRLAVVLTALVWAVVFHVVVAITLLTLLLLLWPVDYTMRWKKFALSRQAAFVLTSFCAGGTPLIGTWLVGHTKSHAKGHTKMRATRTSQWFLWWAYPLLLVVGILIRMAVYTWVIPQFA